MFGCCEGPDRFFLAGLDIFVEWTGPRDAFVADRSFLMSREAVRHDHSLEWMKPLFHIHLLRAVHGAGFLKMTRSVGSRRSKNTPGDHLHYSIVDRWCILNRNRVVISLLLKRLFVLPRHPRQDAPPFSKFLA